MANYLPVLLISVSTNAVPDDSSLSTLPRAQVDYLSHDWQEEDVWKSWRNMTRQKNEITNGMRLENASWRTWWKQRNKLKTVSPETLNWLKDSDVTWLYGPLHTAVEWTPPLKPPPVPDSVDDSELPSAHDRLDLYSPNPTLNPQPRKPILKHRSISELLISDLIPTSPLFSPVESEDEDEDEDHHDLISPTTSSPSFLSFAVGTKSKRPTLTHTKSDTHITRWGPFRKESPPRIDPPGFDTSKSQNQSQTHGNIGPIRESASQDSSSSGGVGHTSSGGERTKKKHISFNTYVEQCIAIEKPKKSASGFFRPSQAGNWVADRTTYLVDDGYEEDEEDSQEETKRVYRRDSPVMRSHTGSPDEDQDDDVIEMRSSSHRNHTKTQPSVRSQSKVSTASSSSSTSTASTNTTNSSSTNSSHDSTDTSPAGSLSPSRINRNPSSSSSSSTATARRYSSSSTYRPSVSTYTTRRGQPPPLIRTPSEHVNVTIAPIAPTILKTTGVWSEGFGDEGGSDDGFGTWNTKGVWSGQETSAGNGRRGRSTTVGIYGSFGMDGGSDKEGQSSDGTPVELVYVPPLRSNHSLGGDDDDDGFDGYEDYLDEDEYKEPEGYRDMIGGRKAQEGPPWDVYHHRMGVTGSVGLGDSNEMSIPFLRTTSTTSPIPIASVCSPIPGLPTVVVDDQVTTSALSSSGQVQSRGGSRPGRRQRPGADEEDAYDSLGAPDMGEDYHYPWRGGRGYDRGVIPSPSASAAAALGSRFSSNGNERQRERERERHTLSGGEERQSRSRSRSQSRTPSPAFISSPVSTSPANGQVQSRRKRSSSASATPSGPACSITASSSTSDLLSPPSQRGRTPAQSQHQSQSQSQSRGRSCRRTGSSPSSWERESGSSSVGSSPMGSLSPDGLVWAGGREREKGKERENEIGRERRGRERTSGKILSASEVESTISSGVCGGSGSSSTTTRNAGGAIDRVAIDSKISSTASSYSSSASTVMGPSPPNVSAVNISPIDKDQEYRPNFLQQQEVAYMRRAEEEEQRRRVHRTPSNSPVVDMRMSVDPGARSGVFEEHAVIDQRDRTMPSVNCGSTTLTGTSIAELASVPLPPLPVSSPTLPHAGGVGHTRSSSYSESVPLSAALSSPSKLRPPPLIPPPPLPAKPSTSFTAVSSSSPNKGLASPTSPSSSEHTIVGKAVDIVSSAGAFLGLWQHTPVSEG